jgi:hypothetical protein
VIVIPVAGTVVENLIMGLRRATEEFQRGGNQATLRAGCEQIEWLMRLAEVLLTQAGVSGVEQTDLLRPTASLHAALTAPKVLENLGVRRAIQKSADRAHETIKRAYAAAGLELRLPAEGETAAATIIGKAMGVSATEVIGWRDRAKRKNPTYPLLHDKFHEALRMLEDAHPGDPQQQYEAWRVCVSREWGVKF